MFWQIYCITSWTAPPVDWQDDPVHIHFYIKFLLLYFFNWNILMCLAFLRLCIKSVLRYLKPCTVWAHSNVLDSFFWPLKGWRHKNASQVSGLVTKKKTNKKTVVQKTYMCQKPAPVLHVLWGKLQWSVFSGWVLDCFLFWLTAE